MSLNALASPCPNGDGICSTVFDITNSERIADVSSVIGTWPFRIFIIIIVAVVLDRLIQSYMIRKGQRLLRKHNGRSRRHTSEATEERAKLRVDTMAGVLASLSRFVLAFVVILLVLGEVGISLAPLLAGASVLGVALGFGAQKIVADFLAGFFMLAEDQFGVGDIIDVGEVSGEVESVSLRMVTLRDVEGTLWFISNSEIRRVANKSQLWSRAVLDIDVAYETDLRRAEGIIQRVADDLWNDDTFTEGDIIDPPDVWGVERLGTDGVSIRLVVKTDPAEQWVVARELRLRIKEAFDEAEIEMPYPQRTVWIRSDEITPIHARPEVRTAEPRHGSPYGDVNEKPSIKDSPK